jgi:gamma-glutamylcyclotransferase (GGCT)/AIG2-like uncharacterized protein YtfP
MPKLFVYGTLMSGQPNHRWLPEGARLLGGGWTRGKLFAVGSYPAMVAGSLGDTVRGEVYQVADFDRSDQLEGYRPGDKHSHYLRRPVYVTGHGMTQAYFYNRSTALLELIPSGDWREYLPPDLEPFAFDDEPELDDCSPEDPCSEFPECCHGAGGVL